MNEMLKATINMGRKCMVVSLMNFEMLLIQYVEIQPYIEIIAPIKLVSDK